MEFEVKGNLYSVRKINAVRQFHIARRMTSILAELGSINQEEAKRNPMAAAAKFADAIGRMSDEEANLVLFGVLAVVQRKQPTGWANVSHENGLMFDDITMPDMLQIAWKSIQFNFGDFFAALPSDLPGAALKQNGK